MAHGTQGDRRGSLGPKLTKGPCGDAGKHRHPRVHRRPWQQRLQLGKNRKNPNEHEGMAQTAPSRQLPEEGTQQSVLTDTERPIDPQEKQYADGNLQYDPIPPFYFLKSYINVHMHRENGKYLSDITNEGHLWPLECLEIKSREGQRERMRMRGGLCLFFLCELEVSVETFFLKHAEQRELTPPESWRLQCGPRPKSHPSECPPGTAEPSPALQHPEECPRLRRAERVAAVTRGTVSRLSQKKGKGEKTKPDEQL